jgi:hypothetical protein
MSPHESSASFDKQDFELYNFFEPYPFLKE